jgi:Cu-Zn family superoxide dismutase
MKRLAIVGTILLAAGCAETATEAPGGPSATAVLRDALGNEKAQATVTQVGSDLRVRVSAAGMAPGTYGVHIHAVGRCEAPGYATAGPHWNPGGRQHGKDNPQGMHMGDLPNLVVGADGRGTLEYSVSGAGLREGSTILLDSNGAAVVIHTGPDDYTTDPSGNSGGRMACGVLG